MQSNIFPKRDFKEFHMNLELDKLYICDDFMSQTTHEGLLGINAST